MKEQEPNTPEFNASREKIWDGANKLLFEFDSSNITEKEKQSYETKIATAEFKVEKVNVLDKYVAKYQSSDK